MTRIRIVLIGISLSIFFASCGAKKNVKDTKSSARTSSVKSESELKTTLNKSKEVVVKPSSKKSLTTLDYIDTYSDIAVEQMQEHKIPASITIAQGILESGSGNSGLTKNSNNHFGIKCHKNWNGGRTYYDDDEKGECFRVYKDPKNSYNDHSRFLTDRKRYEGLFKLEQDDYQGWAFGLSKAGYATDKKYPHKLINIITKYELYKYDEIALGKSQQKSQDNIDYYIVQNGDGLYSISKKFKIDIEELKRFNNLVNDTVYPGQKLWLKSIDKKVVIATNSIQKDTLPPTKELDSIKPKEVLEDNSSYHVVQQGETLYQIAYKYELEIPQLRIWNKINEDEIKIGQKLLISEPKSEQVLPKATVVHQPTNAAIHIVAKGDTLYSIATKNGLSVAKLKSLNNLVSNTISIGQELNVK